MQQTLAVFFISLAVGQAFYGPNATAAAMNPYPQRAGSAAALLGAIQFVLGAGVGSLVGLLHNGTAFPLAGVIALCAVGAYLMLQFLALRATPNVANA